MVAQLLAGSALMLTSSTLSGYLFITGRIKELLITRGGENVAPVPIEEKMLDHMKLLSRCMVVGDNQKFLTMLVALRTEVGKGWGVVGWERGKGGGGCHPLCQMMRTTVT